MSQSVACIYLPSFMLQWSLRDYWKQPVQPSATVAEDQPTAPLIDLNRCARRLHLHHGMKQSTARLLVPSLRVACVTAEGTEQVLEAFSRKLLVFSPHVHQCEAIPGAFFFDIAGLSYLYATPQAWIEAVSCFLEEERLHARAAIGYTRHRTFAVATAYAGKRVLSARDEQLLSQNVPIAKLPFPDWLKQECHLLGIQKVADWLSLERGEVLARLGKEASELFDFLEGSRPSSMHRVVHLEAPRVHREIDPPDEDVQRLLFTLKNALDELIKITQGRLQKIQRLIIKLELERHEPHVLTISPADPTCDVTVLMDLLRLHTQKVDLSSGVEGVIVEAESADGESYQPWLLGQPVRYDKDAANRAVARLRAAFGNDAVSVAASKEAHLPEAQYCWKRVDHVNDPTPCLPATMQPQIRRILSKPHLLSSSQLRSLELCEGPLRLSGGWWASTTTRDYYYALPKPLEGKTDRELRWVNVHSHPGSSLLKQPTKVAARFKGGADETSSAASVISKPECECAHFYWIFFDKKRKRWFLHGWYG